MSIPPQLLSLTKDLLRIPDDETVFNNRLEYAFQKALIELVRTTNFFAHIQQIPTVAEQAMYTVAAGTTRVLAVLHDRNGLLLVSSRSLDLLTTWQMDEPGEPEAWTQDKLPNATPLQFAIHPKPDNAETGEAGLTVIRIGTPVNDNPPQHFYPFLQYRTAAIFCSESTEERDPAAAEFWGALADVWKELLMA